MTEQQPRDGIMTEQRYQLVCRQYDGRTRARAAYSMFAVGIHGAIHMCAYIRISNARCGIVADCWFVPL